MDLIRAAKNMETLLAKACLREDDLVGVEPARNEKGWGVGHCLWMLEQIYIGEIKGEKGHRWLGYAQGYLVAEGFLTLEQCKHANLLT